MSGQDWLPLIIVLSAMVPGLIIFTLKESSYRLRTAFNLGGAVVTMALVVVLLLGVSSGQSFETRLPLLPNIDLVLHADALSLLFVSLSAPLWLVTTIYAIGYLEGSPNRARFFGFFSFCVSATMGIALAGNLITFLIFYELLTLTTYPLIVHRGVPASIRAGRTYLAYTMVGGAILLVGVAWLKSLAGPLDFTASGVLAQLPGLDRTQLQIIFLLLIGGLGVKAALVPLHGWLPVAMAAPAPVSALLHAVAVVKAGAFGIVRVVYDVYGVDLTQDLGMSLVLAIMASITIVYGSIRAVFQNDIKRRLAYSTVSQVSYIALGAAIAGPLATIGGMVHLVHQALMKITLFFCAGNLAETLGIHKVSELNGVGKRMPWTMAAFTLAAFGMIGLPPLAGFVSKWYLGVGALEADAYWVLLVLAMSSVLNAIYFLPILYAAWFKVPPQEWPDEVPRGRFETHWMLLFPPLLTVACALLVGLFAGAPISPLSWAEGIVQSEYGLIAANSLQQTTNLFSHYWWVILTPLLFCMGWAVKGLNALCRVLWPLAALPALLFAVWPVAEPGQLSWLFMGSELALNETSRTFLGLAGGLWLIAGWYGHSYLRDDPKKGRFVVFFLLTMCGNFGLILSQDVFGFITFFTLMSLAAYGLIIHAGTEASLRAGKTYIQWAVIGEILLFAGLAGWYFDGVLLATGSTEMLLTEQPIWVTTLLMIGFGVKAGLLGLHVWLPRAHPVAPIPASALLSGIMVKAGLLGWIRFVPLGEIALPSGGALLMVLGLSAAFLAAAAGILQNQPKAILAYSTVSQMGIISAAIGAGLMHPELWPLLLPAVVLYAVHHGVAKALLFMSVGLAPALRSSRWLSITLSIMIILPAMALAGLPMTSGAFAKSALKASVYELDVLVAILPFTAIGTTLLMLRFLQMLRQSVQHTSSQHAPSMGMLISYTVLLIASLVVIYLLPQSQPFQAVMGGWQGLLGKLWPILLGAVLYGFIHRRLERMATVPLGDLVVVYEGMANGLCRAMMAVNRAAKGLVQSGASAKQSAWASSRPDLVAAWGRLESGSKHWAMPALALLGVMLVFVMLML